ncbi:MAG TPA: hypothetical protein DCP51_03490 [Clostridiales bacterium]|nr:hypothetical protein [Clostridiales bacterium]
MKEAYIRDFNIPDELIKFIGKSKIYENNGHSGAKTLFIDKDEGYFIKIADKGLLEKEQMMYCYFSSKGLSPEVITYISSEKDYLIIKKISGEVASDKNFL